MSGEWDLLRRCEYLEVSVMDKRGIFDVMNEDCLRQVEFSGNGLLSDLR